MQRLVHRALVLTIAFALVASAAAWRQCTALQLATAAAAHIDHGSAVANTHGNHDHHAMHAQPAANEPAAPAAPAADDHGCLKCCAMCTVANALPPTVQAGVTFAVSPAVFFRAHEHWSGNTVAVDPGIPKRIV